MRALGARFTNLLIWELSDSAKLENETEALADRERVRVNNDVVLKLRIIDQLSGQISFGFEYRSDTPEDAEHTDTTTLAAVVYDFWAGSRAAAPRPAQPGRPKRLCGRGETLHSVFALQSQVMASQLRLTAADRREIYRWILLRRLGPAAA